MPWVKRLAAAAGEPSLEQMVEGNTDEVDGIDDESIYEDLGLDDLGGDEPLPEAPPEKPEKVADTKTPDKKG